ncbi:UNKNOWN [Stylonychia lemnae]|uniref:Uncharacterized protein n=1 Tax=Stylonychia lemnae TaxID=5949 RepID=A0A078B7H8_STYLE|nr:UNKNOWN [Stylonychia lemnae]|eukprot:CDW89493.1 UNKNOWN [Stylonychia lemnae]
MGSFMKIIIFSAIALLFIGLSQATQIKSKLTSDMKHNAKRPLSIEMQRTLDELIERYLQIEEIDDIDYFKSSTQRNVESFDDDKDRLAILHSIDLEIRCYDDDDACEELNNFSLAQTSAKQTDTPTRRKGAVQ